MLIKEVFKYLLIQHIFYYKGKTKKEKKRKQEKHRRKNERERREGRK